MSNNKKAFFFPGQGAQTVGMGRQLLESSEHVRKLFSRASELADTDLEAVVLNGPEECLNSTRLSQPAIFVLSMAVLDELGRRYHNRYDSQVRAESFGRSLPTVAAAGLSLGEYSALVFAGSLEFEDALRIVVARGRFMQEACDETPGGMTSLMGLESHQVEEAVQQAGSHGAVGISNYNSPVQTVISGEKEAVAEATRIAKDLGCRRAVELRVAGAYHSSLMASATKKLRPMLDEVSISAPRCPFYSNFTGARVEDPDQIREGLARQVECSVRWVEIVEAVKADGAEGGVEVGPGRVVAGLVKNIDRSLGVTSICEPESIESLIQVDGVGVTA